MMQLFGWKSKEMLDICAHITQKHIEEKVLQLYGINNNNQINKRNNNPKMRSKEQHKQSTARNAEHYYEAK